MPKSFPTMAARAASCTFFALLYGASPGLTADAQENHKQPLELPGIVVVADLVETPLDQIGSSVTIISREDIERSQKTTVLELLRLAPGLDVVQSGGPGGQTSVFMRGGASEHTLVLIDGVEMNDPSSPAGAYDFAQLSSDNIERIEILRGSQSVLYGSDALAGVISIITRRGAGPLSANFLAETGSFNTYRASAGVTSATTRLSYALNISRFDTDGISAASGSSVNDPFQRTSISGRLNYRFSQELSARFSVRGFDSDADLDKSFASFSTGKREDPNFKSETRQLFMHSALEYQTPDARWRVEAGASLSKHDRQTADSPDAVFGPDSSRSFFDGEQVKFRLLGQGQLLDWNRIVAGVESEREQMSQELISSFPSFLGGVTARTTGLFVTDRINIADKVFVNAGIRYDDHQTFGGQTTYRITGSYHLSQSGTRLRAAYSTGFNAPTLFQLFDASFGNLNLSPEESDSWEVGIDQSVSSERLRFGALWFNSDFTNMFGFDPNTFQTINVNSASAEGAEVFAEYNRPALNVRLDYTYTKSINEAGGAQLIRRPKNKLSGRATFSPSKHLDASLSVTHVGSRADNNFDTFPSQRVRLDPYTLVTLGGSYQVGDMWRVFGRIENVFDEDYQEVLFFGTPGRALYAGLRVTP